MGVMPDGIGRSDSRATGGFAGGVADSNTTWPEIVGAGSRRSTKSATSWPFRSISAVPYCVPLQHAP